MMVWFMAGEGKVGQAPVRPGCVASVTINIMGFVLFVLGDGDTVYKTFGVFICQVCGESCFWPWHGRPAAKRIRGPGMGNRWRCCLCLQLGGNSMFKDLVQICPHCQARRSR